MLLRARQQHEHRTPAHTGSNGDLVAAAERELAQSTTGATIVRGLHEHNVKINLLPDEVFFRKYNDGTGGFFDPRSGEITAPVSSMIDPEQGAIMLAHEGTHAIDFLSMPGGRFGGIALSALRSVGAGITAPLHLQNPGTAAVDASRSHAVDDEVVAYMTQARVEDELGIKSGFVVDFGHNRDGSLATAEQTRARVEAESIYQERGGMRTFRVGAFSLLMGMGVYEVAHVGATLLKKELPVFGMLAATGAFVAGMTIQDWATHRDR